MSLLDLLFPPRCLLCGVLLERKETYCPACAKRAAETEGMVVKRFQDGAVPDAKYIDSAMAVFDYEEVKESIFRFKFHGAYGMGKGLGELMEQVATRSFPYLLYRVDVVTAVPIHKSRLRQRGYNQSALLAEQIATLAQKPLDLSLLVRTKETTPQMELNEKGQRLANVADAFLAPKNMEGQKILLIDDIYTTGATANQCAKVCKKAGAAEVHVFTLAAPHRKE